METTDEQLERGSGIQRGVIEVPSAISASRIAGFAARRALQQRSSCSIQP